MSFSKDFVWGAATASYQIEGAAFEDGRGRTVWDDFCETAGNVYEGHSGEIACDHYHRFREDIALMQKLGIKAYRFSVAWSRVIPDGCTEVNVKGLQFYSDLVDELHAHGIEPYATLFHWDLPSELQRRGGWQNPEIVEWFARYTRIVVQMFGDRVTHYFTLNEPQCFLGLGYVNGVHAPGFRMPLRETVPMAHHIMMAHGRAVQVIRELCPSAKIGFAPALTPATPNTESEADIAAAREACFAPCPDPDNWPSECAWWCDPIILGRYPEQQFELYGRYLPQTWQEDLKTICQPLDFFAMNVYRGQPVCAGSNGPQQVPFVPGVPRTAIGWPICPTALYWGARFYYERYGLPILVTENGLSCHDTVSLDGKVHDPNRIDFLHRYLRGYRRAADEGIPLMGYFQWSLLDNFEWAKGYSERFGLVYVDYQTQQRTVKDSAYWYSEVIKTNGAEL